MSSQEHPVLRQNRRVREYWQLVARTAEYRYRICWEGARRLMTERGFAPLTTIQATCDQGQDAHATFVLPDGRAVSCEFLEDDTTRQAAGIATLEDFPPCPSGPEDEYSLAAEILRDERLREAFNRAVLAYFDFHWRGRDYPLPKKTGT